MTKDETQKDMPEEKAVETNADAVGAELPVDGAPEEVAAENTEESSSTESVSFDSLAALAADENDSSSEETDSVEESVTVAPEPVKKKTKWYSLRVISGKERKIKERIDLEIDRSKWRDVVKQVLVPTEKVYKIKAGKKQVHERNILPGYMMVEADPEFFTAEMVQAIANVPNVIHFLGKTSPIPMRDAEANRLLGKVDESNDMGESMVEPFIVGETVKIIDGAFADFVGDVQEVNEEKKKLKVIVKIFGRGTEVELNFMQVEKQQ